VRRARFVSEAHQEFLVEVAYYNEVQAGFGIRFTKAVEEATAGTLAFPLSGTPSVSNTRRVFLKGFLSRFFTNQRTKASLFLQLHIMPVNPVIGLVEPEPANPVLNLFNGY
jgi:hypothetical protein